MSSYLRVHDCRRTEDFLSDPGAVRIPSKCAARLLVKAELFPACLLQQSQLNPTPVINCVFKAGKQNVLQNRANMDHMLLSERTAFEAVGLH